MAKRLCATSPSSWAWASLAALTAIVWTLPAEARETSVTVDLSAGSLPDALAELSREAGVSIGTDGALPRRATRAIHGRMTVQRALERLLDGSGLVARQVGPTAWRIERKSVRPTPATQAEPPGADARPPAVNETIVVTGAKRRTDLADLPMSVSVVMPGDKPRFNASAGSGAVASEMEGMALTALGPGRNRMFLRGISDSAFNGESQSTVAVIMDEARLTFSAPDPDIRLVDVDRVEVLKGPQGSLYGTGVLGGIYHIVTRKPDLDEASASLSGGGHVTQSGGTGYTASGVANLPLVKGRAAVRLTGYSASEAGWVDTGSRKNSNVSRVLGARAGLGLALGQSWRFDATGFAQWLESRDSQYVYAPRVRSRAVQFPEGHDNDLKHLSARLVRDGGGIDVVLGTGVTWHEVGDTLDATIGADSFALSDPRDLEDKREYRVWDNELRLSGSENGWNWLLGLSHVRARQSDLWTLSSPSASLVIDDDRRTTHESALFGDVTVPVGGVFSLNAGARLYRNTVKEYRLLPAGAETHHRHRSGVTPSVALSWRPRAGRLVYLRYSSAIRQGGSDIDASGEFETLKADKLQTLEATWREEWGGLGRLELGTWYSWWRNMQSDLLQANGLIETHNAGQARVWGVEATFERSLAQGLKIEAGGSFVSAKLISSTLDFETEDRHLPAVPEYALRSAIDWSFPLGRADAGLRMQVRYVGLMRLSFDPQYDRPMGNLWESRVEARASLDGFDAALAIDNLLNRRKDTFAFGNSLRFDAMRQYTPQPPRRLSLTVSSRF